MPKPNNLSSAVRVLSDLPNYRGRLFWKIWLIVFTAIAAVSLTGMLVLQQLDKQSELRESRLRPWQVIESLAIEAEKLGEQGAQLRDWLLSDKTQKFGLVYLIDEYGVDLAGRQLPMDVQEGHLQSFIRADAQKPDDIPATNRTIRGLARAVYLPGQIEPLTLVYLPNPNPSLAEQVLPSLPFMLLLIIGITGGLSWLLAQYLTGPIRKLDEASERIASGDFSMRVSNSVGNRKDELATFAHRFDEMTRQLEIFLTTQQTLIRDVSHELRSPLSRLRLANEILLQQQNYPTTKALERIEKEIGELDLLVEEILSLAKLDLMWRNGTLLETCNIDIFNLLDRIVSDAKFEGKPNNVHVQLECLNQNMRVRGDEDQLKQAFENVVRNAIAYGPQGTKVIVKLSQSQDRAIVKISDQGPGVKADDIPLIFEPFYRADESRERDSGGHGIGLAATSRIIRAHRGEIEGLNGPGGGFIISIYLPEVGIRTNL